MSESTEAGRGAVRLRVPDRSQVTMRLECDEQLIPQGHRARTVWDAVCQLDETGALEAFREPIKAREGRVGRDATDPRLLVALWLYACIRGVGSARELARLCVESAPYRWLCGGVTVNHRILSEFRVGFGQALDELFTAVVASLVDKGAVQVRRVSQDGTRVRASAGQKSFRRGQTLEKLLEEAQAHVRSLAALLEDPEKSAGLSSRKKAARRRAADERAGRVKEAVAQRYRDVYGVELDPEREVAVLPGTKTAIVELALCLAQRGDRIVLTDPCYPDYYSGVALAGAELASVPLDPASGFAPTCC